MVEGIEGIIVEVGVGGMRREVLEVGLRAEGGWMERVWRGLEGVVCGGSNHRSRRREYGGG